MAHGLKVGERAGSRASSGLQPGLTGKIQGAGTSVLLNPSKINLLATMLMPF